MGFGLLFSGLNGEAVGKVCKVKKVYRCPH